MSYLGSAIAILVCGAWNRDRVAGRVAVGSRRRRRGLTTAFAAMIAATLLFACGVALGRALQLFK
jgi:hypothetical protein